MRILNVFLLILGINVCCTFSESSESEEYTYDYTDELHEYKQQTRIGKCSNVTLDDIVYVYRVNKWALPFVERSDTVSITIFFSSLFL